MYKNIVTISCLKTIPFSSTCIYSPGFTNTGLGRGNMGKKQIIVIIPTSFSLGHTSVVTHPFFPKSTPPPSKKEKPIKGGKFFSFPHVKCEGV